MRTIFINYYYLVKIDVKRATPKKKKKKNWVLLKGKKMKKKTNKEINK